MKCWSRSTSKSGRSRVRCMTRAGCTARASAGCTARVRVGVVQLRTTEHTAFRGAPFNSCCLCLGPGQSSVPKKCGKAPLSPHKKKGRAQHINNVFEKNAFGRKGSTAGEVQEGQQKRAITLSQRLHELVVLWWGRSAWLPQAKVSRPKPMQHLRPRAKRACDLPS